MDIKFSTDYASCYVKTDPLPSNGRIVDYSTNSSDEITVASIEAGIIRDVDAIACIESAKLDITCNDTYIISCLHFSARHNKFIGNNVILPYFRTCV